jgi:hypothetical protein
MPRIDNEPSDLEAAWAKFEAPAAWRCSKKGNLWRTWNGQTCTLFRRGDRWCWSVADEEETRYSPGSYETEEDARSGLGEAVGVGW